jgi:ElaA protein
MNPTWSVKEFDELKIAELYEILHLRCEVFVVEQNCVFQDVDFKDQKAYHVMGRVDGKLAAYTRLLPAGVSYPEISIGRVVTAPFARNSGIGKKLMQESIDTLYRIYGRQTIKIGAQFYLKKFYESFGFQQSGEIYPEDGIDHIEMLLHC